MAYKCLPVLAEMFPDAKTTLNEDILANINDGFYSSYDWFTIQEETTRGLGICDKDVDARVGHVINSTTGMKLGDDFKRIFFNGIKSIQMGNIFSFDNNYWLVINVESIKSPTSTCTVRRCNNMIRWLALDGSLYQVPCNIDYQITRNKDLTTTSNFAPLPQGMINVLTQHNAITSTIQPNQRFLFGNVNSWVAYKIVGGGIENYQNTQTVSNTSYGILGLIMEVNYENNQNDDFTNGIANADKYVYSITVAPSAFSGVVGNMVTLIPTITLNGEVVERTVTWTSGTPINATVGAVIITGMAYASKVVTLTVANSFVVDDIITVEGVNSGYAVTNIDGTWICESGTSATTVVFTVTTQPTGTTPQTTSHGAIIGVVTLVHIGTSIIRCTLTNNITIYKDIEIKIVASSPDDNYSFTVSPITNSLLLYAEQIYTVHLYNNGSLETDAFVFTVDATNEAPVSCYEFNDLGDDKSFRVLNLAMSIGAPLVISAVSGGHTKLISILLNGAY